jgi:hypothetical protein
MTTLYIGTLVINDKAISMRTRGSNPRSTALDESTLTILHHQCGSEKYMNKYFEYMTGYIVLILKAYIKMGEFLNGTTVGNFTLE